MKNAIVIVFSALMVVSTFLYCDKVEPPFKEVSTNNGNNNNNNNNTVKYRKVLVEDYTGHRCTNCPRAHEVLVQLEDLYGEKIVPIGMHIGFFASPSPPSYPSDFRTTVGEEINSLYHIENTGLPKGMINRKEINGTPIVGHDEWGTHIATILEDSLADIYLEIENSYNTGTKVLTTTINTEYIESFSVPVNLSVYIAEDSIIAAQLDENVLIPNYLHMQVNRGALNGTWGDLISASAGAGDTFTNTYSITLDDDWIPAHCHIVAFVFDAATNEVIQSETRFII